MNDAYYEKLIRLVTLRRMRRRAAYKAKVLEDNKRRQMNTMHRRLGKSYSMLFKPILRKI
jgi:hypothetical protein